MGPWQLISKLISPTLLIKLLRRSSPGYPNLGRGGDKSRFRVSLGPIFLVQSSGSTRGASLQLPTKWRDNRPVGTQPILRTKMGI